MNDDVLGLVVSTVEELASELGYDSLRKVNAGSELYGGDNSVDSLTLVRLIAELERSVGEKFGREIVLADERAMSRRNSPFRTVGALAEFVNDQLANSRV